MTLTARTRTFHWSKELTLFSWARTGLVHSWRFWNSADKTDVRKATFCALEIRFLLVVGLHWVGGRCLWWVLLHLHLTAGSKLSSRKIASLWPWPPAHSENARSFLTWEQVEVAFRKFPENYSKSEIYMFLYRQYRSIYKWDAFPFQLESPRAAW